MVFVVWTDPPPEVPPPAKPVLEYTKIATELRNNSNVWGLVATAPQYWHHAFRQEASVINRNGRSRLRTFGAFQATARLLYDSTALYMRYVGPLAEEVSNDDLPTEQHDDDR